jgi:hypothetical protein
MRKYIKAFMAGVALPVIICPLIFMTLVATGKINVLEHIPMYFVPMIWGLWNIVLVGAGKKCMIKDVKTKYLVHGGTLGLILALLGLYVFNIDIALFGISMPEAYWMLIVAPLVYGIIWGYIILPLNNIVGLKN